jgi:hypothetical protein
LRQNSLSAGFFKNRLPHSSSLQKPSLNSRFALIKNPSRYQDTFYVVTTSITQLRLIADYLSLILEPQFRLSRVLINSRSILSAPSSAFCFANAAHPRSFQGHARFIVKDVGYQSSIAHQLSKPPSSRRELGGCVWGAICAKPDNFKSPSVLIVSRDRATDHSHAADTLIVGTRNAELHAHGRLMMAMIKPDKLASFIKFDWYD